MERITIDQQTWNAINKVAAFAEVKAITSDPASIFQKQQLEIAIKKTQDFLIGLDIEPEEYGIEEAEEDRFEYERIDHD